MASAGGDWKGQELFELGVQLNSMLLIVFTIDSFESQVLHHSHHVNCSLDTERQNRLMNVVRLSHADLKKHETLSQSTIDVLKLCFSDKMSENSSGSNDGFLDDCLALFEAKDVIWWLLLVDGVLITVGISVQMQKEYFVYNLCTHPSHQRLGYAKYLLFEMQKLAMKDGCIGFKGNVDLSNTGAIAFYTKYGAYRDNNFGRSSPDNPAAFMRLLYRWNQEENGDVLEHIRRNQAVVLKNFKFRCDRPVRIKRTVMLSIGVLMLCVTYKWMKRKSTRN